MGIDVNLYAIGTVTDDELTAANAFLAEREVRATLSRYRWRHDRIEADMNGARYYGPHYERGPWPEIHLAIVSVAAALPNCVVHYGGDTDPESPEATPEALAEIWAHWLSPHWNDYRKRGDDFNASLSTR
jgi:hypothetical protein